jgi:biotin carboxyl carrier protein
MTRDILAPLDGKVCELKVTPGDTVEEDEEILVIEAMKMETPVFVPCDGVVKEVNVKEGDEVTEKDVLAVIEKKHIEV